ncbi:ImmA/IrrE family metallo-endopeptidase [Leptospira terpstrae]|uniref:ImmA/IrrE family metallo-endopeptidase n=1 Tax=Leptospira terpstrae TaxID=293075 RepID=UPI003D04891C
MTNEYYKEIKLSANLIRKKYSLTTGRLLPSKIKQILKHEGVKHIIPLDGKTYKKIRGGYEIHPQLGPIVYIRDNLPPDPLVFTLSHELKHHLHDQNINEIYCSTSNEKNEIEIAAEIFAAELIYPEELFLENLAIICPVKRNFEPADLVKLKIASKTTLSYSGLCKRLVFYGFSTPNKLQQIKWKTLELELFPNPFIKKKRRITAP